MQEIILTFTQFTAIRPSVVQQPAKSGTNLSLFFFLASVCLMEKVEMWVPIFLWLCSALDVIHFITSQPHHPLGAFPTIQLSNLK